MGAYEAHWYEVVTAAGQLRQGDIFRGLPIPLFPENFAPVDLRQLDDEQAAAIKLTTKLVRGDWIVLEASCDVDHDDNRPPKAAQVLVAPVKPADLKGLGANSDKDLKTRREVLRRGFYPGKFMLADCEKIEPAFPLSFAEYRQHLLVPHGYLIAATTDCQRLRLRHPVREQFGTWVGNCISRVGPETEVLVTSFTDRLHDSQLVQVLARES